MEKRIKNTILDRKHLQLVFHKIGSKNIKDYLRKFIKNYNYTFSKEQFFSLLKYLKYKRDSIWIAPIIQIFKYETEFQSSS